MKVLVVGGGSGGHITPAVAVVRELLKLKPRTRVEFWTDRKYYKNVVKITTKIGVGWGVDEKGSSVGGKPYIRVRRIMAGKFHRYAGWKLADYFENWQITLKDIIWGNLVGFVGCIGGIVQSFVRLFGYEGRPDVIFLKGGFVGLPVGLVARLLGIPYVIHESDAVPGLANRLLMKHAATVCLGINNGSDIADPSGGRSSGPSSRASSLRPRRDCGCPPDESTTVASRFIFTGTPVAAEFKPVSENKQKALKKALGFDESKPLVIVTGGSQGAVHINEAVREILPEMLEFASVGLIAGRKHYEEMVDLKEKYEEWDQAHLISNFRLWNFSSVMEEIMGAADVVVSRAGATTIAELAALKKALVLVPFEKLPGGHQVKNADRLAKMKAAVAVRDERMVNQPGILLEAVKHLVRSPKERKTLAENLHEQAQTDAAKKIAQILVDNSRKRMTD